MKMAYVQNITSNNKQTNKRLLEKVVNKNVLFKKTDNTPAKYEKKTP